MTIYDERVSPRLDSEPRLPSERPLLWKPAGAMKGPGTAIESERASADTSNPAIH
jgi:hypothetical protein